MTRHEDFFRTTDIELSACIMTALNRKPMEIVPGVDLVEFIFPSDETVQEVALKYAAGRLVQEVRRLAANRSWLYRQTREVARTGQGVRP